MGLRRLQPGDAVAYRSVRLAALRDAAHAFGSTYETESKLHESAWRARLEVPGRAVFVIEEGADRAVELYRRNGFDFSGRHLVRERDGALELEMVRTMASGRSGRRRA